jgi:chromosome segregation ATPase
MDSWGAATPKEAIAGHRHTQAVYSKKVYLQDNEESEGGASLLIDSNPRLSRGEKLSREDTEHNMTRSNLVESSHGNDPQTINRQKRGKTKRKKVTPHNNSISKGAGSLRRDQELEHALTHNKSNQPQGPSNNIYHITSDSESNLNEPILDFERNEYKKIKAELKGLKRSVNLNNIKLKQYEEALKEYEHETNELRGQAQEYEDKANDFEEQLRKFDSFKRGLNKDQLKELRNKDGKRKNEEIRGLKQAIEELERINRDLIDKVENYDEMEIFYQNENKKLESQTRM